MKLKTLDDLRDDFIVVEELTDDEWLEIKKMAIEVYDSGHYDKNMMKCCIAAFVDWLDCQDRELIINTEELKVVH